MNNCSSLNFNMRNNIFDNNTDFEENISSQSKAMGFYNEVKFNNEDCNTEVLLSDIDETTISNLDNNVNAECINPVKVNEESFVKLSTKRTKSVNQKDQDCNGCASNSSNSSRRVRRSPVMNKTSWENKHFKCPDCNYSGHTSVLLKRHQLSHLDVQKLKCPVCDYSTSFNSKLKEHLVTHSDNRPFMCSKCKFASKLKSNLNKHEKTHNKIYKCDKCDYIIDCMELFREHKKDHTA